MIKQVLTFSFVLLLFPSLWAQSDSLETEPVRIQVLLKDVSGGDFGFQDEWSYPIGVYWNKWGQLSCDGICPPEIDRMKGEGGRIYDDSLTAFYNIVDTTHLPHTIKCEASMYEFAGTNFINFQKTENGVIGTTTTDPATHSTLSLVIENQMCTAWVDFNSINPEVGEHRFELLQGRILLDKSSFENGIIKGSFDFRFVNHLDSAVPLFWRGTILSTVEID